MLASITPLGERGRQRRWGATVIAYGIGSIAGGITTGALAGALGSLAGDGIAPWRPWVIGGGLVVVAAWELGLIPAALPSNGRQVNEDWLDEYRGWVVGLGFGFQLGLAFVTIVTSAAIYLTFVIAALTGTVAGGIGIGAVFGIARALPMIAVRTVDSPERLAAAHRRMAALAGTAHTVVAAGAGALAVAAAVVSR